MPCGLYIDIEENTILNSLDIKDLMENETQPVDIYLGIPLWESEKANTYSPLNEENESVSLSRVYELSEIKFNDENTGENQKDIQTRKINASFFVNKSKVDNYELIHILKLRKSGRDRSINEDEFYIPPCVTVDGSEILLKMINDIVNKVKLSASEHMTKLATSPIFYGKSGKIVKPISKLMLLNKHYAKLSQLVLMPKLTPFEIYLELRTMYGELCGLTADENIFKISDYNHDDLFNSFKELNTYLDNKIKFFYKLTPYIRSAFELNETEDRLSIALTDEQITNGVEYILSVSARKSAREIMKTVEKGTSFKLMSPETSKGSAIPGLKLTAYFDESFQLPQSQGRCYFQIGFSEDDELWQSVMKEKSMVIVCNKEDLSKINVELFVMIPEKQEVYDDVD